MPPMEAPVESCKYFPTRPLPLANPLGNLDDFEFNNSLADSHALAASITTLAETLYSCRSSRLTKETPVAFPSASVMTSRAMALGMTSTLPVSTAGFTSTEEDEKSPYTWHPRLHWLQKKHAPRLSLSGNGRVRIERREGITGMFSFCPAFFMYSSCSRGLGGGRNIPSGSL